MMKDRMRSSDKVHTGMNHALLARKQAFHFGLLVVWSVCLCGLLYSHAMPAHLSYMRVAEGNISHAVRWLSRDGWSGYVKLVADDARQWGRIRPMHNLFHAVPFYVTMLRNGDLSYPDDIPLYDRLSGDLQTHTLFLLFCLTLAVAVMAYFIGMASRRMAPAFLFPVLFFGLDGLSLAQNLIVFHCDSGEIAQLLFISLYSVCMTRFFKGEVPSGKAEAAGCVFLLLAYAMKETSLVLMPVFLLVALLSRIAGGPCSREYRRFVWRHGATLLLYTGVLLGFVYAVKEGAYVSDHYGYARGLYDRVIAEWGVLTQHYWPYLAVLGVSLIAWTGILVVMLKERRGSGHCVNNMLVRIIPFLFGLAALFWAINVPWALPLIKYYLPVHFFLSASVVVVLWYVYDCLAQQCSKPAGVLWIVGVMVYLLIPVRANQASVRAYFKEYYEYRKSVPAIVQDYAQWSESANVESFRVHVVACHRFQEGALQFLRLANRKWGLNVAVDGVPVSRIRAIERNYFRRYEGARSVQMSLSSDVERDHVDDLVYVIGEYPVHDKLLAGQYALGHDWFVGSPAVRIRRYERNEQP